MNSGFGSAEEATSILAIAKLEEGFMSDCLLTLPHPEQSVVPDLTAASAHPSLCCTERKHSVETLKTLQEKEVTDGP